MARPDHFTRPIQSDRMLQSYGNTRLVSDGKVYPRELGKTGINLKAELIGIPAALILMGFVLWGLAVML